MIKIGGNRIVFVFKYIPYIIKIPNLKYGFKLGMESNKQEYKYSKLKREDLCEVKFNLFNILILMDKADVISNNISWLEFQNYIENKYRYDNMSSFMLEDIKPSNWGILNGKLVKIDYGKIK